ncbi:hypothetical protein [Candidatus Arsenophonus triatominarum]
MLVVDYVSVKMIYPFFKKAEKTVMELSQIPLDLIGGSMRLEG